MTYRRKVFLDENNYLTGFTNQLDGTNEYELTIEILHSPRLNCWKLVDGNFVFDTEKEASQIAEEERLKEIAELKQKLKDSDYIHAVLAEKDATEEYYADKIAERKAWRARIRELEN